MTDRRDFIKKAGIAAGSFALIGSAFSRNTEQTYRPDGKFKLKYAPQINAFRDTVGDDPLENIKFMHDQGFTAVFDNGLPQKDPALQEQIVASLAARNMDLGPFVLYADFGKTSFVEDPQDVHEMLKDKMTEGAELAGRTGAKTALVVPGRYHAKLAWEYQTANVVQNLRYCCERLDALQADLVLVIEPLNSHVDHPGLFLTKIPQAYMICKAVNHPKCKIVNDLYHQQIQEGNLINNITMAYSEIAAFHVGDNPGRREPTSGEINYRTIFRTLYEMEYDGTLCMEHGKSVKGKEGDRALIEAYRWCDDFL